VYLARRLRGTCCIMASGMEKQPVLTVVAALLIGAVGVGVLAAPGDDRVPAPLLKRGIAAEESPPQQTGFEVGIAEVIGNNFVPPTLLWGGV
jgi:hypothetical protein